MPVAGSGGVQGIYNSLVVPDTPQAGQRPSAATATTDPSGLVSRLIWALTVSPPSRFSVIAAQEVARIWDVLVSS